MKCVIIVNEELPIGLIANTTAALGVSLASVVDGLIGGLTKDKDNRTHQGLTNIPIPILCLSKEELKIKYDTILDMNDSELFVVGFSELAQSCHVHDEYERKLKATSKDFLHYSGICLYGPKKKVNKLTGSIKMLR